MTELQAIASALLTQRARPLSGRLSVPGDPLIGEMSLLIAAMALGESRIANLQRALGVDAMIGAIEQLGARVQLEAAEVVVDGLGVCGFLEPTGPIACTEGAQTSAMLAGAVGIYPFSTRLNGDVAAALVMRPTLGELGIGLSETEAGLVMQGPRMPVPGPFTSAGPTESTALLLATCAIAGTSTILETIPAIDHCERLLGLFGAQISASEDETGQRSIRLAGLPELTGRTMTLGGDPAAAAVLMIAGLIVNGSDFVLDLVLMNPWRGAMLQTLMEMGADLRVVAQDQAGGEDVASVRVRHSILTGTVIPAERMALLQDVLPFLVVAASFASGDTVFEDIELTTESDGWLSALVHGLSANGVPWATGKNSLIIHGRGRVTGGGTLPAHTDPRLPLSFMMMGMATRDPIRIADETPVAQRFPGLIAALEGMGAMFKRSPA